VLHGVIWISMVASLISRYSRNINLMYMYFKTNKLKAQSTALVDRLQ
jgi:hypothetical protein